MRRKHVQGSGIMLGFALWGLAAAGSAGCEAVPDIRFIEDDARADTSRVDGGGNDGGGNDGTAADSAPVTCLGASPGAGATCCGKVWCLGDCDAANCAACETSPCQSPEVCCGRSQTVSCKRGACN